MKIDKSNISILNSKVFSVHDDIFHSLAFDRASGVLTLFLQKDNGDNFTYKINCINVIGFAITSCDFWGRSPHILDFEYAEYCDCKLLPKIYEMQKGPISPQCKLTLKKDYIEIIITFTSGDKLNAACEYIVTD